MKLINLLKSNAYARLVATALVTLIVGTVVYRYGEHLSWLNAYYFSVITLTTVGYGDITPTTPFTKIFTTFYVLIGVGIITTFITTTVRRRGEKFEKRHGEKQESD